MSPAELVAVVRAILAAGLPDEAAAEAISRLCRDAVATPPPPAAKPTSPPATATVAPRSPGADRQRRWRERRLARDAHETSPRRLDETPRDAHETPPSAGQSLARSLEDLSLLPGSAPETKSKNPPTTFGGGPPHETGETLGETPRDASRETPGDAWGLAPPGVDPDDLSTIGAAAPSKRRRGKSDRDARATRCPTSSATSEEVAAWLTSHTIPASSDPRWGADVSRFVDHHRAKGTRSLDWAASWRTWRGNAERWAAERGAPMGQRPGGAIRATPQNTLTPEYIARVQAVHDLHVAEVEARVAAEKALPPHKRDVFGPDWEPLPIASGDNRG